MQRPCESLTPHPGFRPSINSLYQFLFCKHAPEVLRRMGGKLGGSQPGVPRGAFHGGVQRQAPTTTSNTSEFSLSGEIKGSACQECAGLVSRWGNPVLVMVYPVHGKS